ncbi:RDD family protein [Flavobacterium sp. N1719]|uniref:RDD family protein n=1 Tax=Flavobacterium sp. N1719 TaxID=2885633 RepID=UPI0022231E84|nr:RDD family protein [Flavobacterium sp. N1719]
MYPQLQERTKAAMIDSVLLISLIIVTGDLLQWMPNPSPTLKATLFFLYFVLYEPLLVSIRGGTIGHALAGISIRRFHYTTEKINFFAALWRFLLKITLGWISVISYFTNKEGRMIHDKLSGAIMVYSKEV